MIGRCVPPSTDTIPLSRMSKFFAAPRRIRRIVARPARIDRHSGQLDELDVEGIPAFAERVLPSASNPWVQSSLNQKQRLQQLFFLRGFASTKRGLLEPG